MSSASQPAPPPSPNRRFSGLVGIFLGILVTLAGLALAVWLVAGVHLLDLFAVARGERTTIRVDEPTVVRQIQQLQRLETVRSASEFRRRSDRRNR